METLPLLQPKTIKMSDLTGKKACCCFVEINFAPASDLPESLVTQSTFNIQWEDGSVGLYKLTDICRFELYQTPSTFSWASHGMAAFEFVKFWHQYFPETIKNTETKMAAYHYKKLTPDCI